MRVFPLFAFGLIAGAVSALPAQAEPEDVLVTSPDVQQTVAPWAKVKCLDCGFRRQISFRFEEVNGEQVAIPVKSDHQQLLERVKVDGAKVDVTLFEDRAVLTFPQIEARTLRSRSAEVMPGNVAAQALGKDATAEQKTPVAYGGGEGMQGVATGATGIGLVASMRTAYAQHIPLAIRPDDIWINIVSNVAAYTTEHAEEYRDRFVDFDGKQGLVLQHPLANDIPPTPDLVADFTAKLSDLAGDAVKDDISSWIIPSFSTTRPEDQLVAQLGFLSVLSPYFEYYGASILCGLPQVTLEGTVDDWKMLRARAARLQEFDGDLKEWSRLLLPVLDQMVAAREGKGDFQFWQTIVAGNINYGCGGPPDINIYGWSAVFAPFTKRETLVKIPDADGETVMLELPEQVVLELPRHEHKTVLFYQLWPYDQVMERGGYAGNVEADDLTVSLIAVDVTLVDLNSGVKRVVKLAGGGLRSRYDAKTNTIRPFTEWAMYEVERGPGSASDLPPLESCTNLPGEGETLEDLENPSRPVRLRCTELPVKEAQ